MKLIKQTQRKPLNPLKPLKKSVYWSVGLVALSALAETAFADTNHHSQPHRYTHNSSHYSDILYGELRLLDIDMDTNQAGSGEFETDTGRRAILGYRFSPTLALEFGYNDFSDAEESSTSNSGLSWQTNIEVTGYTVGLKGFLPLSERAELWGSMGLFLWELDFDGQFTAFPGFSGTQTGGTIDDGEDLYFGFGIHFLLSDEVYAGFGYSNYEQTNVFRKENQGDEINLEQDLFSIGVGLHF